MSVIRRIPTLDEDGTFPERFVPTAIPQAVEDAQDAATEATTARDVTVAARGEAVAARDAAIASKTEAEAAAAEANTARDAALTAKDDSVAARDGAVAAKDLAVAAKDATLAAAVIVGVGRPDVPATLTTPGTAALVAAATSGAEFRSIDGPQGAWVWRKRGSAWVCVEGDTGWRPMSAGLINGWVSDSLRIRRVGPVIYMRGRLDGTAATSSVAVEVPAGFRWGGSSITSTLAGRTFVLRSNVWTMELTSRSGSIDVFVAPWASDETWPAALPY